MEREIEFRAWDKPQNPKKMLSWEECLRHFHGCYEISLNPFEDKYLIWMQYTGLRDKNDKKIFEGDIVKMDSFTLTYQIKFLEGAFCLCFVGTKYDGKFASDISYVNHGGINQCEILGNIYENPELLV